MGQSDSKATQAQLAQYQAQLQAQQQQLAQYQAALAAQQQQQQQQQQQRAAYASAPNAPGYVPAYSAPGVPLRTAQSVAGAPGVYGTTVSSALPPPAVPSTSGAPAIVPPSWDDGPAPAGQPPASSAPPQTVVPAYPGSPPPAAYPSYPGMPTQAPVSAAPQYPGMPPTAMAPPPQYPGMPPAYSGAPPASMGVPQYPGMPPPVMQPAAVPVPVPVAAPVPALAPALPTFDVSTRAFTSGLVFLQSRHGVVANNGHWNTVMSEHAFPAPMGAVYVFSYEMQRPGNSDKTFRLGLTTADSMPGEYNKCCIEIPATQLAAIGEYDTHIQYPWFAGNDVVRSTAEPPKHLLTADGDAVIMLAMANPSNPTELAVVVLVVCRGARTGNLGAVSLAFGRLLKLSSPGGTFRIVTTLSGKAMGCLATVPPPWVIQNAPGWLATFAARRASNALAATVQQVNVPMPTRLPADEGFVAMCKAA